MDKHAYLIMCHNNFFVLEKLITLLDNEKNDIFIHVDKKVKDFNFDYFKNIVQYSKLYFVPRINIKWASISQIEAELNLFKFALNTGDYLYYHLISGADLPLKNANEIYEFFEENKGKEFVGFCTKFDKTKVEQVNIFKNLERKRSILNPIKRLMRTCFIKVQLLFNYDYTKKFNMIIKKGCNWVSITQDCAKYIVDSEPLIKRMFKYSLSGDEFYKQTLIWNSPFKENVYDMDNEYNSCMRQIDWDRGSPYTFRMEDFETIINSNKLFARKFDENTDKKIVNAIYNHISNTQHKKSILIVVDNLAMGGVTKVLANMLKLLDYSKYEIDLLVLHYYKDMNVDIPESVNIIHGNAYFSYIDESIKKILKNKEIKTFINKLKLVISLKTGHIKTIIEKSRKKLLNKDYDTEIAFCDGFSHIFVANGNTPNKIAWMHTDISVQNDSRRYYKLVRNSLHKMDMCVCVSDSVKNAYKNYYNLEKIQTIHNVMDTQAIISKSNEKLDVKYSNDSINLVSVGRLDYTKNYKRFIYAHKKLIQEGYKINSYLIGDGLEKEELEKLIIDNNIEDSFKMLGKKDNPFPYIKNADMFILSSIVEGLPTVLYEAIILGTPCVSTNVAGAEEILQSKYGLVTKNDDEALYLGIKKLLDDTELLNQYKSNLMLYQSENSDIIKQIENIL